MRIYPVGLIVLNYLMGCGSVTPPLNVRPQNANAVSLPPQNWCINYSAGMPPNPSADVDVAWSFSFPSLKTVGHVNYVQTSELNRKQYLFVGLVRN